MTSHRGKRAAARSGRRRNAAGTRAAALRIIGGQFRGRKLRFAGDPRVRPMKDRVREAVFNLIGPAVVDKHALDLFAGSGALALEALSRGAASATLIEQHYPTAEIIRQNVATLGVDDRVQLVTADVFRWLAGQPELPQMAWLAFCSPPWDYFAQRGEEMLELIARLRQLAPAGSLLVVEADDRFELSRLPDPQGWDIRRYPPAVVAIA